MTTVVKIRTARDRDGGVGGRHAQRPRHVGDAVVRGLERTARRKRRRQCVTPNAVGCTRTTGGGERHRANRLRVGEA